MRVLGRGLAVLAVTAMSVAATAQDSTPLFAAVKSGELESVRALLAKRADPNAAEIDGTHPLHWAAHFDNLAVADLLLKAGASVQAANRYGVTPLWLACINGSATMAERLMAAGADPNTKMAEGDTALMTAARTGNPALVKLLVAHGADVNASEAWKGQTALMWAAAANHAETVRALVDAGADVQARTNFKPMQYSNRGLGNRKTERNNDATKQAGFTALHFAVRAGATDAVKVLLKSGATVRDATSDGTGVLVMAIASTHFELADWLLEQGADPNAAGQGWTPLHQLITTRRPSTGVANPGLVPRDKLDSLTLAERLLAHGANPNQQGTKTPDIVNAGRKRLTEEGASALWLAAQTLDLPMLRLLLKHGGDPLLPNISGDTPLLGASGLAIEKPGESPGTPDDVTAAVKILLDLGADPNTIDEHGDTALHGAAIWGSNDAIKLLVAAGARLDVKNKEGRTPWRIAEGASFEDSFLTHPETAALLKGLMEERGLKVE